jgi:hypothetical protein
MGKRSFRKYEDDIQISVAAKRGGSGFNVLV